MAFPIDALSPFLEVASWVRLRSTQSSQPEIEATRPPPFPLPTIKPISTRKREYLSKRNLGWHHHNYPIPLPLPASAPDFLMYVRLFNLVLVKQRNVHSERTFKALGVVLKLLSLQDFTPPEPRVKASYIEIRDLLGWLRPGVQRYDVVHDISQFYKLREGDVFLYNLYGIE